MCPGTEACEEVDERLEADVGRGIRVIVMGVEVGWFAMARR